MKGGKEEEEDEEEKAMGPLFPRLHVNDAGKGGPRAPPRNKMALYEQLSIPSQRFNSAVAAASVLPLPPHRASALAPSVSSSQGCGHERSIFSPFYGPSHTSPHSAAQSVEKLHSRSSEGMHPNVTRNESEKRSVKHVNNNALKGAGSVAECSSHCAHEFSKTKSSCAKKFDDDNDFGVPTFIQSRNDTNLSKGRLATEAQSLTPFRAHSPNKGNSVKKSRQNAGNHTEQRPEVVLIKEHREKSASHLQIQETTMLNAFENSRNEGPGQCDEAYGTSALGKQRCSNDSGVIKNGEASKVRNESCSEVLLRSSHRSRNAAHRCSQESDVKPNGSVDLADIDRNGDVSEASMVDSLLGLEISPDDVVGAMGPKQFWKARRAIVDQQRVFAVQVFELHRLIKVQKLIAASPHILLEDYSHLGTSLPKLPTKNLLAECNTKSEAQIVKHKDDSQTATLNMERPTENTVEALPLPSCEDGPDEGVCWAPRSMAYAGNPPSVPAAPENKSSPWCCHPPASQWLIPVMSPSEGLVYKPYPGPYPPVTGFMAPVYGSCSPLTLPHAYGVPASHQQRNIGIFSSTPAIAPNYSPAPYGRHVVNPIISASAVEQVSPMVGSHPNSEAFSGCLQRFQASKNSEIQGSTASSPCKKAQGEGKDALPLFSMAPVSEGSIRPSESSRRDNNQTQVIKVVPHNPRSATESAARIFQSIQQERQQCDT